MTLKTMKRYVSICFCMATLLLALASCASKKAAVGEGASSHHATNSEQYVKEHFAAKVFDNQVYTQNIVGNMSFNLKMGSKDITVPGSVHMRKDKVIRLQLFIPLLGTEVGRLEFTPTYVLVVDRLHKEYIKADYNQVDFLQRNGITFYSLQALFWNQLFLPGKQEVKNADLKHFVVSDVEASQRALSLANGNMTFQWKADDATGRIASALVSYKSAQHGQSDLNWKYGAFKAVGVKQFPAQQSFTFTTTATKNKQTMQVNIKMSEVKTTDKWDAETTLSSKYKKVEAEDVLGRLLQM